MDRDQLVIAAYQGGRAGANGWVRANCPFCPVALGKDDDDYSFGVQEKTGKYMCFKCETWGRLRSPPDFFPIDESWEPEKPSENTFIDPPDDFVHLSHGGGLTAAFFRPARDHLFKRKLTNKQLWADAYLGVCMTGLYRSRIIVPIRDATGRWYGFSARDFTGRQTPKYKYPPGMQRGKILYEQHLLDYRSDRPVLLVEGVFDALPYFGSAVASLGKPTDDQMELLYASNRPIAVCLDGDAWELGESVANRLRLEGVRAGFVRLPPKKDPGEVAPDLLLEQARACVDF